jgi:hypothetical protein
MNVLKNFEALFVVTLGLACAANYVMGDATANPAAPAAAVTAAAAPAAQPMSVIVVSAKRLSAEQKLQSLADERKAQLASTNKAASAM